MNFESNSASRQFGWNAKKYNRRGPKYHNYMVRLLKKFEGKPFDDFFSHIKALGVGQAGKPYRWMAENYKFVFCSDSSPTYFEFFYLENGIIRYSPAKAWAKYEEPPKYSVDEPANIKIDGIYYRVTFKKVRRFSAHLMRYVESLFVATKKQLNSKELKRFGLRNDT